jgi:hypothetical protein
VAWLARAGVGTALGFVSFLGALFLLINVLPFQALDGSCDGGTCLFDPEFWFANLGMLLTALVLSVLAALAAVSFFTVFVLARLKQKPPGAPGPG